MIKFEHTKHKALWNMIIDVLHDYSIDIYSAADVKREAFDRLYPGEKEPEATCYACEYDEAVNDTFTEENQPDPCDNCPLLWPEDKCCDDNDSLFDIFLAACRRGDRLTAIRAAKYIRDCPVKENVETE